MKTWRIFFAVILLLPVVGWAQTGDRPQAAQSAEFSGPGRHEGADSTVLVVPFEELAVQRLDALMDDSLLEVSQLGMMVWDLSTDTLLYARWPRHLLRTASTMKLLTAITALDCLGPDYRYTTQLCHTGTIAADGRLDGDLVCVGGMDPLFDRTDMQAFVGALRQRGVKRIGGRIVLDCSMKEPEKWGEGWCWDDKNPTLSPLLFDGKADFGEQLLRELQAQHIATTGAVATGALPADARLLCQRSHTIGQVLAQMMKESDNLFAEATYYQVAASTGHRPATAADARSVERELLARLGLDPARYRLADGSGLSLYNYLTAEAQVMLLRHAWQQPAIYAALLPTLPVAGVDGTLKKRMRDTAAQGNVQAKTGTVSGVSALSGYCTAPNGHRLAFCIVNQGVRHTADGRAFQDRVCLALCQP